MMRRFLVSTTIVAIMAGAPLAEVAHGLDLDRDGRSDIFAVTLSNTSAVWQLLPSSANFSFTQTIGSFGQKADYFIPGSWVSAVGGQIGVLQNDKEARRVMWKVLYGNSEGSLSFGEPDDIFVSGGDFDGNGVTDAAVVKRTGEATVHLNPFAGGAVRVRVNLLARAVKRGHTVFINRTGAADELATVNSVVRGSRRIDNLNAFDLVGSRTRVRFRSKSNTKLEKVLAIAQPHGVDALVFIEVRGSRRILLVKDLAGRQLYRQLLTDEIVVVGDYLAAVGEEIALYNRGAGAAVILNPFNGSSLAVASLPQAIPVGLANVSSFYEGKDTPTNPKQPTLPGQLSRVCPSIRNIQRGEIYKTVGSDHFSDARRGAANFIVSSGLAAVRESCIRIYDSNGSEIYQLGAWPDPGSEWASRHYGTIGCSRGQISGGALAGNAWANTGSSSIYLKISANQCIYIPDAGRCINSSQC